MRSIVKDFLKSQNWQYSEIEGKSLILFGINGENGNFQCIADIIEETSEFIFFSICGSNVPIEKRSEIIELLNQINFRILLGNFVMDPEDGEIRFRTSVNYNSITPSIKFVENIIMPNIITVDSCLPAIMGILFSNISISDALKLIEGEIIFRGEDPA